MKKVLFVFALVVVFLSVVMAQGECRNECGVQKNQNLQEVNKLKDELAMCKPGFLRCVHSDEKLRIECQKEYSDCKLGGREAIRDKNIEANNLYKACLNSCGEEFKIEKIGLKNGEVSPFCMKLQSSYDVLARHFSKDRLSFIFKINNCPEDPEFFSTL